MGDRHVLLITFPIQGQITPSVRLAMRLLDRGIKVTIASSVYARSLVAKAIGGSMPNDLTYASIPDGFDDGLNIADVHDEYMTEFRSKGSEVMKDVIAKSAELSFPVTCLVYTILLPWASEVAREHRLRCMLLWIQAATVMNIYYYYFNGFEDEIIASSNSNHSWRIQFPRLQLLLSKGDLPSFLPPPRSDNDSAILQNFKEHIETLDSEAKPRVLVNTFDALEADALKGIEKYELIGIGPLILPAILGGKDDCGEWLNSKQESSVVYVSFGSLLNLEKKQMEEIARGLCKCKVIC